MIRRNALDDLRALSVHDYPMQGKAGRTAIYRGLLAAAGLPVPDELAGEATPGMTHDAAGNRLLWGSAQVRGWFQSHGIAV